jgi:hypothetical protein
MDCPSDRPTDRDGDFTKIDLAWLNWWLKDDETATRKGLLVGTGCPYCSDSAWEYKTAHLPQGRSRRHRRCES